MTAGTKFIHGGAVVLGIAGPRMADAMKQADAPPAPLPRAVIPSTAPVQHAPH